MSGRSIRIFLPDGTPGNLFIAEIVNWTGQVTVFPRLELSRFLRRDEAQRPGVYLMLGEDPNMLGRYLAYVGETETLGVRLRQHDKNDAKPFWDLTFAVSSKDANLTKAHVRYLEARLVQQIVRADRVKLVNGTLTTSTALTPLPESDIADMEFFLAQVTMLLPVLGFDGVRPKATATLAGNSGTVAGPLSSAAGSFPERFVLEQVGVEARALDVGGEFTVLKGSTVRLQGQSGWTSYKTLRERLVAEHKIGPHTTPDLLVFQEDVAFRSTSAAASVILGRNANGRTAWKHEASGQLYREWQDLNLPPVVGLDPGHQVTIDLPAAAEATGQP